MKVVLELQDQPSNIKKVTIRHDIVIGRGAECNLRLSAPQVSRRHCFLRVGNDGASVTDLDSSNGTWVNGEKINSGQRFALEDGMTLAVGPVQFVARVSAEVKVSEELQVELVDDRLRAHGNGSDDSGSLDATATISEDQPEDDSSNLNFSIEQGGLSTDEDEPTADYIPTDSANNYFADVDDVPAVSDLPDLTVLNIDSEPETIAVGDNDAVQVLDEVEIVEEGAPGQEEAVLILDEVEVVENVQVIDEAEIIEDVEIIDEVEIIEDVDEVEIIDDPVKDEQAELKDFLTGLD